MNQSADNPQETSMTPALQRKTMDHRFSVAPMLDWTDVGCMAC